MTSKSFKYKYAWSSKNDLEINILAHEQKSTEAMRKLSFIVDLFSDTNTLSLCLLILNSQ